MKLPLLGPVSLTGFQNAWFFLFLLIVLLVIGIYIAVQFARRQRVLRFANMYVLERVAPIRTGRGQRPYVDVLNAGETKRRHTSDFDFGLQE